MVFLYYSSKQLSRAKSPNLTAKLVSLSSQMLMCAPVRFTGLHVVLPTSSVPDSTIVDGQTNGLHNRMSVATRFLFHPTILIWLGPELRARTKIHTGSLMECWYGLRTFGIPTGNLPLTMAGHAVKLKEHSRWMRMRQDKEAIVPLSPPFFNPAMTNVVICPRNHDVLLGKGAINSRHPGNIRMRAILK